MRRFSGSATLIPAVALLLALAGAAGIGPPLGGRASLVTVVDVSPSCLPPSARPDGAIETADSDLGAALRAAVLRGAERVRLVTDGCDVTGRTPWLPDVSVDVVLRPRRDDVGILEVAVPARIVPGIDFSVSVRVGRTVSPATGTVAVEVRLLRDGARVGPPRALSLQPGETRTWRVRDRIDAEATVRYRAEVAAPVGSPLDDHAEALARAGDRPRLLVVGEARGALPGFAVRETRPETAARVLDAPFDVILLAAPAPPGAQERIVDAVRGGAGLVVQGGGGYAGRPLEEVLPLTDRPPGGRATVLLLDFSGSMARRKEELLRGVARLRATFAPDDRLAFVAFRRDVFARSGWSRADATAWTLRDLVPRGNTRLAPALRAATDLLGAAGAAERRLFVVSDGAWHDLGSTELRAHLEAMAGTYRAALFVQPDVTPEAAALFDRTFHAGDDLAAALEELERTAPGRLVPGPVDATTGAAPDWLEGAVPPAGAYRGIVRLHPRGADVAIPLRAGALPLLGAWEPAGRVVVAAAATDPRTAAALAGLARSVVRPGGAVRLRASRRDGGLAVEAAGGDGADFEVDGRTVAARPAAPGVWRAYLAEVEPGPVTVRCGPALLRVDAAARAELAGLGNRPDIAAAIAARTGGRLYEGAGPAAEPGRRRPAVFLTLLGAAVVVLASALRRRRR